MPGRRHHNDGLSSSEDEEDHHHPQQQELEAIADDPDFINDGDLAHEKRATEREEKRHIHALLKQVELEKAAAAAAQADGPGRLGRSSNPRLFSRKEITPSAEAEQAERAALAELAQEQEVVGFTKDEKYSMPAKLVARRSSPIKYNILPETEAPVDQELMDILADCQEEEKQERKQVESEKRDRMLAYAEQRKHATPQRIDKPRPLSSTPVKQPSQSVPKYQPTPRPDLPPQGAVDVARADDGSVNFYWYDAHEMAPMDRKGEVILFGKVKDKRTGQYVSATLVVRGLQRIYYAVPKGSSKLREIEDTGEGEPPEVDMMQIYEEIENIRRTKYPGIHEWKCKMVKKRYAFELPLPHREEMQVLKIKYDAQYPPLQEQMGRSFQYLFGVNSSLLEGLLLKRKIMGPCWLKVHAPLIRHTRSGGDGISWSRVEMETVSYKNVQVDSEPKEAPALSVVSLAMKVARVLKKAPVSTKKGGGGQASKEQIAIISMLYHRGLSVEQPTPATPLPSSGVAEFSFVAKIENAMLNFQQKVEAEKGHRFVCNSEKDMLTAFLARLQNLDPDIIVAHNASNSLIELLVTRMQALGVAHFSRIGRLKQTRLRTLTAGQMSSGGLWISRQAVVGRLLVDTSLSAQELLRESNYTLGNLVQSQLSLERADFDEDQLTKIFESNAQRVVATVDHTKRDAQLVFQLMLRLNVIPLTKKLTNIAGNLWYRSLQNARAERNQFLLAHTFHNRKFLLPDKRANKKRTLDEDGEEEDTLKPRRQKAAYSGGLVLEPEVGFYDRYILLLDFNSLYPSIIREFNICFTTIRRPPAQRFDGELGGRSFDEADVLLPDMEMPASVLPGILEGLVQKRKAIKRQMKEKAAELAKKVKGDPTIHPDYLQLDTAQKAYKLTANSIYGCLGFSSSRFFAKPLAALITRTGRELLRQTVELSRKLEYPVIYGDTDSIMVDSRSRDIAKAVAIANRLKTEVNAQFKKGKKHRGLLEIDIDGIFQSLLLLKKKKYAALMLQNPFEVAANKEKPVVKRELKGLDAVRRDWSPLSANVQKVVLDLVLSGLEQEDLVTKLHDYFRTLNEQLYSGSIALRDFLITKGLSRMPTQYRDVKSQPHVAVALRLMEANKLHDLYIPYAICKTDSKMLSEKAFHPDEINARQDLVIDLEWYIVQQILPPISRILSPLEGIQIKRIAELLGVDSRKYEHQQQEVQTEPVQAEPLERGKGLGLRSKKLKADIGFALKVVCPQCVIGFEIEGPFHVHKRTLKFTNRLAYNCPGCEEMLPEEYLQNRISFELNRLVNGFYQGESVCPELTCKKTSAMFPMHGEECLYRGCGGNVQAVISDRKVDKTLQYLDSLFEVGELRDDQTKALSSEVRGMMKRVQTRVGAVKGLSEYSTVDLGRIFRFF